MNFRERLSYKKNTFAKSTKLIYVPAQMNDGLIGLLNGIEGCELVKLIPNPFDLMACSKSLSPDIILCHSQWLKPSTSGSFLYKLRKCFRNSEVVVVSNEAKIELITQSFERGATGFLCNADFLEFHELLGNYFNNRFLLSTSVVKEILKLLIRNFDTPLSLRELEVLRQFSTGKSCRAVAGKLEISPDTARTHLRNIYKKLGVRNKSEALEIAIERQYI